MTQAPTNASPNASQSGKWPNDLAATASEAPTKNQLPARTFVPHFSAGTPIARQYIDVTLSKVCGLNRQAL
jgi:hypothetical protein